MIFEKHLITLSIPKVNKFKPDYSGVVRVGTGRYVLEAPGCRLEGLRVGGVAEEGQVPPHHRRVNEEAVVARLGSRQEQGESLLGKYVFGVFSSQI